MGILTPAFVKSKVPRQTYYNWLVKSALFKSKVEDVKLGVKDFGESALYKLMEKKNPAAVIFFNKCKNQDRGYIEKQQIEHQGNFGVNINLIEKSEKEIKDELGK